MYQISPMNWLLFMLFIILSLFYLFIFLKYEKMSYFTKYYMKI
uniref:ATPase subunit 8 n=1 Tax=Panonychus ulmi TaxID=50024 RepID=D7SGR8_PANUL|nr:ATP synthase F0 subunit 8 [Panonychus ulmi]ACD02438.1 ATPase subunit 8 [Panonychus ulmi]